MGGCTKNGGIKLGSVLKNKELYWNNIQISSNLKEKIETQLILIYTGETRLAKNLLQVILFLLKNYLQEILFERG